MALKTEFRLNGKDINFLTKKKQYVYAGYFSFFYFKQYENLKYNQISVNISIKLSKSSVLRHIVKRAMLTYVQSNDLITKTINNGFYKVFVMLNKNQIDALKKLIEKSGKKHIISLVQGEFANSWKLLIAKI